MTMLRVGDYEFDVTRVIGEGSFGSVFKGNKVGTPDIVAGKRVVVEKDFVEKCEKEANFLLELPRHDNIVTVLSIERREYEEEGVELVELWIVTEYYPSTFKRYACGKDLSFEAKIDLMVQCCRGLHHLHQHDVVHRDIKPDNLMVVEEEGKAVVKIIDFGESRLVDRIEGKTVAMNTFAGTKAYMAPEMLRQDGSSMKPNYTTSVDVFALGVTFLTLMKSPMVTYMCKGKFSHFTINHPKQR